MFFKLRTNKPRRGLYRLPPRGNKVFRRLYPLRKAYASINFHRPRERRLSDTKRQAVDIFPVAEDNFADVVVVIYRFKTKHGVFKRGLKAYF